MAWSNIIDRFRGLQGKRAAVRTENVSKDAPVTPEATKAGDGHHSPATAEGAVETFAVETLKSAGQPVQTPQATEKPEVAAVSVETQAVASIAPTAKSQAAPERSSEAQLAAQWAARRSTPLRTPRAWEPAPPPPPQRVEVSQSEPEFWPDSESIPEIAQPIEEVAEELPEPLDAPIAAALPSPEQEVPDAEVRAMPEPDAVGALDLPSAQPPIEPESPSEPDEAAEQPAHLATVEALLSVGRPPEDTGIPMTSPLAPPPEISEASEVPEFQEVQHVASSETGGFHAAPKASGEAATASFEPLELETLAGDLAASWPEPSTSVSLPPTPWATQLSRDTSSHPPQRFAMLHAVARRWHHLLPNRRFVLSIGSRAEARKLAPVIRSLRGRATAEERPEEVLVCATGEQPESVRQVLESLGIAVDCNLDLFHTGEDAAAASARMLSSFESLLAQVRPQWLIVEGATTASAMASVAAYYAGIRVARVEGGPTPFNIDDLYPAEVIRQVVGLFSSVHFAETDWSREQLVQEGIPDEEIFVIGNTGVDAVHETCTKLGLHIGPSSARSSGVVRVLIVVERRGISESEIIELCHVVRNLVGAVPGLYEFVWPLPTDPAHTRTIRELLGRIHSVSLTAPADYEAILRHIHACDIVLTDSPDLQEEAPSLGKPVLVMRESIDRPEAVRAGVAILVGTSRAGVQAAVRTLARKLSSRHGLITNPYGDGRAAARIADFFEGREVLEFGRTTQRRMLPPGGPTPAPRQLEASTES